MRLLVGTLASGVLLVVLLTLGSINYLSVYPLVFNVAVVAGAFRSLSTRRPGYAVFSAVAAVRYFVLPILMMIENDQDLLSLAQPGWLLFLYEELVVLATIFAMGRGARGAVSNCQSLSPVQSRAFIHWGVALIGVVAIVLWPGVMGGYSFILNASEGLDSDTAASGIPGPVYLVVRWVLVLLPVLFATICLRRYRHKENVLWYYMALAALGAGLLFIPGSSRQAVLIPGVAALFFMLRAAPQRARETVVLMSAALLSTFVVTTALKFGERSGSFLSANSLNAYFNGPKNLALAMEMIDDYGHLASGRLLFNDIFGNVPGVGADLLDRTITYFNFVIYRGAIDSQDQIVPFSGQVLFHFGWYLVPVPIILVGLVIHLLDQRFSSSQEPVNSYLLAYFSTIFGMSFMLNLSIISSYVATTVIPGLILIWLASPRKRVQLLPPHAARDTASVTPLE